MDSKLKRDLEEIFRASNSPDELFDTFRVAIERKIHDEELYKILLRNKALSVDEISMFTEKICKEFPDLSYNIYFCVGQLLESISTYGKHNERALQYFEKAANIKPESEEPYLAIVKMYNNELNIPRFETVTRIIEDGITKVKIKSSLCFALAELLSKMGDKEKSQNFKKLGDIYLREGS
jgi:tetratricopeptide (TPR) repeat protein